MKAQFKGDNMPTSFTVKDLYAFYLQKMGLNESQMHPVQKRQVKDAFYGGLGMFITCIEEPEIANLPSGQFDEVIESFNQEIQDYWIQMALRGNVMPKEGGER